MQLRTKPIKVKPKEGDIKRTKKFAWWPRHVEDKVIWLESYWVVEVMSVRPRIVMAGHYPLIAPWGWDFVREELNNNR